MRPVQASADVRDVLNTARQMSDWTNGKFDVTFGALSGFWKFDHDQDNVIPDMREVRRRLPLDRLPRDSDRRDRGHGVSVAQKGMSIHLGGIGKGYAIDRGAGIFDSVGIRDFMIQSGGDIYVAGLKDGRPWRLGIQDPGGRRIAASPSWISPTAPSVHQATTSESFIKDGHRYHHILDPATGQPARGVRSATIVTNRAVIADGLSTGVFILGPDVGMAAHREAARCRRGDRVG